MTIDAANAEISCFLIFSNFGYTVTNVNMKVHITLAKFALIKTFQLSSL